MNRSIAEVTTAVAGGAGLGSFMSFELFVIYKETESCSMDPMTGVCSFICPKNIKKSTTHVLTNPN